LWTFSFLRAHKLIFSCGAVSLFYLSFARVLVLALSSAIVPDIQRAFFECMSCHVAEEVDIVNGRISEPTKVSFLDDLFS